MLKVLNHPVCTPEADEKRLLAGLPFVQFLILFLWRGGLLQSWGAYPILANFGFWGMAYLVAFRKRLQKRGEFKGVLIAWAVLFALLLGVGLV